MYEILVILNKILISYLIVIDMKKTFAVVGTLLTTLCVFIWEQIVVSSATEVVKTELKPVIVKMLKVQLDESNLTKTDDEELAQNLGEQFIKKNQIDISCQEGESAQECQTRILERAGFSQFQKELDEFNTQYEKCEDGIAMDRRIDLQNHSLVFQHKIRCMIVNNQGEMLDKIAESDDNLAQTIYEVKKSISPSYK